jgi:hypothetical protein
MAEPALAQQKKQLSPAELSARLKELEKRVAALSSRLQELQSRDFGSALDLRFNRALANLPQEAVELSSGKKIGGMAREELLAFMMKYRPSDANQVIAHLQRAIWKAEALQDEMRKVGLEYFNGDEPYQRIFILGIPAWKTIIETAGQLYQGMKKDEEQRFGSDIALLRKSKGEKKGEREQELKKSAFALKARLDELEAKAEGLATTVKLRESKVWRKADTDEEKKAAAREALQYAKTAKALRAELLEIVEKAKELKLGGRELQSSWAAAWGASDPMLMADTLERTARALELKAERAEALCGVKPYPTIGAQRFFPVEIGGQKGYIDAERGILIEESEENSREFRKLFNMVEKGKKRVFLSSDELWEFVPLLPKLDSILKTVKIWKAEGYKEGMMLNIELNILFSGLDLTIMSKVPATTAARVTGRELASAIGKGAAGRLAMTTAERDVFLTALQLGETEFKNLWRIARSPSGGGLGWTRVCAELADMAGGKAITAELVSQYLARQTGKNWFARTFWVGRKGAAEFVSEGLILTSRNRFRNRVLAEIANELRGTISQDAGKELMEMLGKATLSHAERRVAADTVFLAFTSFSPKAQQSLLALVRKEGWPYVVREIRRDVALAERQGVGNATLTGMKKGLGRLVPEYEAAFGYEALARHILGSSAMYFVVAPVLWTNALKILMSFVSKEYVGKPPASEAETVNAFDRESMAADERAGRAAGERVKRRSQK